MRTVFQMVNTKPKSSKMLFSLYTFHGIVAIVIKFRAKCRERPPWPNTMLPVLRF